MHYPKSILAFELVALALGGCGYREVEPARAPLREIPVAPGRTSPPKPGETRVILDANGEPAAVTEVTATGSAQSVASSPWGTATGVSHAETVRPVCITPCVSDFEPGMHVLRFQSRQDDERMSTTEVQIDENTKAIRHSIGRVERNSAGYTTGLVMAVVGAATVLAGGLVWGLAAGSSSDFRTGAKIGKAVTAVGGATFAFSIPLTILTRPILQKGTTTEISE